MKTKIAEMYTKFKKALAPYKKNIIIPLFKLLGIIIVCAVIVRLMNGRETLADYARKNPDVAYQTESSVNK